MGIWAHTMVKNDSRWLWYSVTSVIDFIDKLLLWDMGSTDDSIKIEKILKEKYPDKIILNFKNQNTPADFTNIRQEMLSETKAEWYLMVDADEVWWRDSIQKVVMEVKAHGDRIESIVVPTINAVGDVFHYMEKGAGRYTFGNRVGHYNLRAVNRSIPGLHSLGVHGVWGWADVDGKMVQDRDQAKIKFIDAPYFHTTFLRRGGARGDDLIVSKRPKKLKYEIGLSFPKDYFYPESFFINKPDFVKSPWEGVTNSYKVRAFIETPLRKIKRKMIRGGAGY
jgi:glycosyltransferase involved in cell wall biosynthesis